MVVYLTDVGGFLKTALTFGSASLIAAFLLYVPACLLARRRVQEVTMGEHIGRFFFIVYLVGIALLAFVPHFGSVGAHNLIPFQSIRGSLQAAAEAPKYLLFCNIILFAPMGACLPGLFSELRKWYKTVALSLCCCLAKEIAQAMVGYGRHFDIDSLIMCLVGASIGYFGFYIANKMKSRS